MKAFWTWCRAKFGRIVTLAGAALASVDVLDITPIKAPLTNLIGTKGVQTVVIALFVLSWARHQYVASQNPK